MTRWISANIGDELATLVASAKSDLLVVAPFIKVAALDRLLQHLDPSVQLKCITRWHIQEIASGAGDLDVYRTVCSMGGSLWLNQSLHAKVLVADQAAVIGSANITNAALGWSNSPNLELVVDTTVSSSELREFEQRLSEAAIEVDDYIYDKFSIAIASQEVRIELDKTILTTDVLADVSEEFDTWLPKTRDPALLYAKYAGISGQNVATAGKSTADADLAMLNMPQGLSEDAFGEVVSIKLLSFPMIVRIDHVLSNERRFGEMRDYLADWMNSSSEDASLAWQATMRWLLYFLHDRYHYSRPRYSEIMVRYSPDN